MAEHSTFWLLYGKYGPHMTLDLFHREYFGGITKRTLQNYICNGDVPKPTINGLIDVRDVAAWWDGKRKAA
jgi:hypothetical protein